jgi:L-fucose isomerase-like protein
MLVLYSLKRCTPWTADFVNYFEESDSLLFWHCGNASYNLSDKKPSLEVVFEGLAQTASIRPGIATICRVNHLNGKFIIFGGIGEIIESEPIFKGSNAFIRMYGGNMEFVESMLVNGIPHHVVLAHGDIYEELKEFANLMNIPFIFKK